MFLFFELFFISLLVLVLYMLVKDERIMSKSRLPKARAEASWSGSERRRFQRFSQELAVTYSVLKKAPAKNEKGTTVDISEGGLKLLLDKKLPETTPIELKITLPGSDKTAEMTGEVMWTEDAPETKDPSGRRFFYSGIKFSSIKEPAGASIMEYVRALSSKSGD